MIRFGTDGIRGVAGSPPCTPEVGIAVGRAAVRLAGEPSPRVLVVRDTRPSGPMLEAAVAAGIAGQGGRALLGGVLPTSALSAALAAGLADTGVMLTASHNPACDNGFKVFARGGGKLSDADIAQVEAWLTEPGQGAPGGLVGAQQEVFDAYTRALEQALPDLSGFAGRRIAVDLAHGAAVPLRPWLEQVVPAELVFVGDGDGEVNDGCGSQHPDCLARAVREHACDAGFAVDGDADRCRLVDENGRVVSGDGLAWLLATGLAVQGMAATVMSNAGLELSLPGVHVVRTDVGDRHLKVAMDRDGLPLGCEESGHVLFHDGLPSGDGLLTGFRALAFALGGGRVSDVLGGFRELPRVLVAVRLRAGERPPLDQVPAVEDARVRGLEQLGEGGRVFLRYSGTEPVLRVLVEGTDADVVHRVCDDVARAAREALA